MILFLVLVFFLASSFYVLNLQESVKSADSQVMQVYRKVQALHIFESALPIVIDTLKRDDPNVDSLKDSWAFKLSFKDENAEVSVTIYDEERFLNINHLKSENHRKSFERLLRLLNIDESYLNNILIWIGEKKGTFDSKYPIKRAPFHSKEELNYLGLTNDDLYGKEIGGKFYPGLLSLVTVNSSGKVNVNTAPFYILMSLDQRIDETLALKIIERRNRESFKSINDLVTVDGFTFDILYSITNLIDVKSRNFHILAEIKIGEALANFEVIYDRISDKVVSKKII